MSDTEKKKHVPTDNGLAATLKQALDRVNATVAELKMRGYEVHLSTGSQALIGTEPIRVESIKKTVDLTEAAA